MTAKKSHPKGLYVLCSAEATERFGFYLLAALLIFWLTEKMGWSETQALSLGGWFKFWVYLVPFFGGLLADRLLGYVRAIRVGSLILGAGYAALCFVVPGSTRALYGALALIVLGNGLFKPNISTLVGNLYPQGDPRRDDAFNRFYLGINIGALVSPLAGEAARRAWGFPAAFALAAAALVLGHGILLVFKKWLAAADTHSSVAAIVDVPVDIEDAPEAPHVERQRIAALFIMCGIMTVFWMAFYQNDNALALFARDNTNRLVSVPNFSAWGTNLVALYAGAQVKLPWWRSWEIPPGVFNSVNPAFIILLTSPTLWLFRTLRKRGLEPSTPAKMMIGMLLTAVSFGMMVMASLSGGNTGKVSLLWLVGSYFFITIAELFVSPMGLSMVTKLAPRRMTAMLMGVWFISTAIGGWLAGMLGKWCWTKWPHSKFFGIFAVCSVVAAGILLTQYRRLLAAIPRERDPEEAPRQEPKAALVQVAPTAEAA